MEEDIKVRVCRLCFGLISDKNYFLIENSLRHMVEVIITDLNLDSTYNPVMCSKCSKLIQGMFTFKTNFFENEERIEAKMSTMGNVKYDLRDIMGHCSKRPIRRAKKINEGMIRYCRICLKAVGSENFVSLNIKTGATLSSIINSCLPDMDLQLTKNPVMCLNCNSSLQKIESFKYLCYSNESKINIFTRVMGTDSFQKVNLHEILYFSKNHAMHMNVTSKTEALLNNSSPGGPVKIEDNNEEHLTVVDCLQHVLVKMESSDDEQELKADLKRKSERIRSQSKAQKPMRKIKDKTEEKNMTYCADCNFKTKYKYNLKRHLIFAHKRKDIQVNKKFHRCMHCNFSTKWNIDLSRHLLSHVKPEALKCTKCPYSTSENSRLIYHILSHVNADNINKHKFLHRTKTDINRY